MLTSYDGQSITYDPIGNPLSYLGNTLTWQNGRQLASCTNGTTAVSYSYDVNGLRTEKAVTQSGETTNYQYFYNGSTLLQERIGSDTVLNFVYTADGKPYALEYSTNNGTSYTTCYYLTNLQGDVVSILDSNGAAVVSYSYDSWGKITATTGSLANTLGKDNPLRYRGYVYDEELSYYYLQSRYYDPNVGRFINADIFVSTGQGILGNNMFAYCGNDPICFSDRSGTNAEALQWWASAGSLLTLIDGLLPIGDAIYIAGLAVLAVGSAIALASSTAEKENTKVESVVVSPGENHETQYSIYFLHATGDPTEAVIYVGRVKTCNFNSRMAYHRSQGRSLSGRIDGLTYEECRALEQAGMLYHHTIGKGKPLMNQINGISPSNPQSGQYWLAAHNLVTQNRLPSISYLPISYLRNLAENEALNMGM